MPDRLARGTREWVKITPDAPLGQRWFSEYALFCLGIGMAVAGALEFQLRIGKAERDFEDLRKKTKRSIVSG